MVHDPVDGRGGQARVPEHRAPLPELYVRRDDRAPGLVRRRHDPVEQPRPPDVDRHVAVLVDDRQVRLRDVPERRLQPVVGGRGLEHRHRRRRLEVAHPAAALRREDPQRDGQMGLSAAAAAVEHEVPGGLDSVTAASEFGGITAYWDKGIELAVTDMRQIRPVPIEEELKLFAKTPCLELGDSQAEWDNRCEENAQLVSAMEGFAERKGCMWAVKRTFLDAARESRSPRFGLVDGDALSELIEGCDAKNGMDVGSSAKRIAGARSMMMIAYGQGYRSPGHGDGIVEELIGCRLVRRSTSELYREKIDGGMSTREDTSPMPSSPSTSTSRSPSSSMTAAPSQAENTRARIWGDSPFEGRDDAREKACPGAKRGGWLPVEMVFVSPDSSLGSLRPPRANMTPSGARYLFHCSACR